MSTHRRIELLCVVCVLVACLVCAVAYAMRGTAGESTATGHQMGYEETLFDTSKVHTIDIVMNDWDSFIQNCENEEYGSCAVVVDGESFKNVAIRAKGNTSLSNVKQLGSERYSFKIEFDHFESSMTYHGLDKLSLNNIIQDNTYMKDYLTYTMMNQFGVDSPLASYVFITVNGEDWGLYLAVESVEDSFLQRVYGVNTGDLYKPDSMSFGGGRGNGREFDMDQFISEQESEQGDEQSDAQGAGQGDSSGEQNADKSTQGAEQGFDTNNVSGGGNTGAGEQGGNQNNGQGANKGGRSTDSSNGQSSGQRSGKGFDMGQQVAGQTVAQSTMQASVKGAKQEGGADGSQSAGAPRAAGAAGTAEETQSLQGPSGDGAAQGRDSTNATAGSDSDSSAESSAEKSGRPSFSGGNRGGFGGFGGGMGSSDVKLQYIDDDPSSYQNIFDNAKTPVTAADKTRLIESLRKLSAGEDLEDVLDMQEVLRYFVVHDYVCNGDSYTGSMIHNYYLHEGEGKLAMIPWDYNLAFGGFAGGDATATVNSPIDDPTSSGFGFGGFSRSGQKSGDDSQAAEGGESAASGEAAQGGEAAQNGEATATGEAAQTADEGQAPQTPQSGEAPRLSGNGGMPEMPGGGMLQMPNGGNFQSGDDSFQPASADTSGNGNMPQMPGGGRMPQMPEGMELPEGMEMPQMPGNGEMPQMPGGGDFQMPEGMEVPGNGETSQTPGDGTSQNSEGGSMPSFPGGQGMPSQGDASSGNSDSRPMVDWIFSDEKYTEEYHKLYQQFLDEVDVQSIIAQTEALIAPYVERDPTKFCTYEEFQTGVETLREFCELRSQSVQGQLDGTIPSTEEGQQEDSSALVDASGIAISDMGSMGNGGGGPQQNGGQRPSRNSGDENGDNAGGEAVGTNDGEVPSANNGEKEQNAQGSGGFNFPGGGGFGDFDPSKDGGFTPPENGDFTPPSDMPSGGGSARAATTGNLNGWFMVGASVAILACGIGVALLCRRP